MFKKILLPIDLSETKLAEKAVKIAIDEARRNKAELHLITVVHGFDLSAASIYIPKGTMKKVTKEIQSNLKDYVKNVIPDDINVYADVVSGDPSETILEVAEKIGVDLIVIPSHSRTIGQILLGSSANKVVMNAKCPVLVVKSKDS
jgi:nucleotide-binding universal stress UspA family protein